MFLFFETIALTDGQPQHREWHMARMADTLQTQCPGANVTNLLRAVEEYLSQRVDGVDGAGRLRLEYDATGWKPIASPFTPGRYATLKPVESPAVSYSHKRTDRSALDAAHAQRGEADDVLILHQGFLTDTCIANLMLLRQGEWFTPEHALLPGTKRARYMAEKHLVPIAIPIRHLERYEQVVAINALRDTPIERIG